MELHEIEKQLILYTKGHFKRIDYDQDLKYFASALYGLSIEHTDKYNILHMVVDLYESLVNQGYIKFKLKNFLSYLFKRADWNREKNVSCDIVLKQLLAEIQGIGGEGLNLDLGQARLDIIPVQKS